LEDGQERDAGMARTLAGCLPLLMTLLSVAIVLFYTVYYGAGAYLGGWNV
jgi:hypothetical protein